MGPAQGTPEPVRVGLLGVGSVAQVAHLPAYNRLRNVRLVALCDSEPRKLRALRQRTEVEHAVSSIDELLAIDEVDAVDVCLPTHLHADAVVRCLEAGRHVLCEKPLARSPAEVDAVVAASRDAGRVVLVGMNHRFRDDSILLKEVIEEGSLGTPFHVRAGWHQRRERVRPDSWHHQRSKAGGGVMMDLGIHQLDLALWLTGYPPVERASAAFHAHVPEIDVEDTAVVQVRCAGGLTIALDVSWRFITDADRRYLEVHGTEGSATLDPLRVLRRLHGGVVDVTPRGRAAMGNLYTGMYEREIAFFGEVAAGREEAPPLEEQVALARVLAAIDESAATSREVEPAGGA